MSNMRVPGNPNGRRPPPKGRIDPFNPKTFDAYLAMAIVMQEQAAWQQEPAWPPLSQAQATPSPRAEQAQSTPEAEPQAEAVHNEPEPPAAARVELTAEERRHFELLNHLGSLRAEM